MEQPKFSDTVQHMTGHAREYLNMRVELLKLILVEKMSRLSSLLLLFFILFILAMFAGVFLALAFVLWYGESIGPMWIGALIVVGLVTLKAILIFAFRRRFLLNPIIRQLSDIIMEDPGYEQPK